MIECEGLITKGSPTPVIPTLDGISSTGAPISPHVEVSGFARRAKIQIVRHIASRPWHGAGTGMGPGQTACGLVSRISRWEGLRAQGPRNLTVRPTREHPNILWDASALAHSPGGVVAGNHLSQPKQATLVCGFKNLIGLSESLSGTGGGTPGSLRVWFAWREICCRSD